MEHISANCPALEGCYTQGSYEEAMENIKDVIQMCLEELKEEKKKVDLMIRLKL